MIFKLSLNSNYDEQQNSSFPEVEMQLAWEGKVPTQEQLRELYDRFEAAVGFSPSTPKKNTSAPRELGSNV